MVKILHLSAAQFTLAHVPIDRADLTVNRGEWCKGVFTDWWRVLENVRRFNHG
ncbi:MAG: hypothetical protein M1330_01850 [Armatimonadetes bacterium]|nr:hypothetical protein [Armatimonadota bacterium]